MAMFRLSILKSEERVGQSSEPRTKDDPITQEHKDLAATLRDYLERAVIRVADGSTSRQASAGFAWQVARH